MRTVTFSDPAVAKLVNQNFVAVWKNRDPGFHNCEVETETWRLASNPKAFTTRNIVTYILTPDLQVLDYMTGYYHPQLFQEELNLSLNLMNACFDGTGQLTARGAEIFRDVHRIRAEQAALGAAAEKVRVDVPVSVPVAAVPTFLPGLPGLRGAPRVVPAPMPGRASVVAKSGPTQTIELTVGAVEWDMKEAEDYLARVHRHLTGPVRSLEEILEDHEYGNSFAEESPEAAKDSREWMQRQRARDQERGVSQW